MDKAASKGVIHKNQAANRKSGIMALANTIVTDEDLAAYEKPGQEGAAEDRLEEGRAKAERKAAMEAASEEKAKRREKHAEGREDGRRPQGQGSRCR